VPGLKSADCYNPITRSLSLSSTSRPPRSAENAYSDDREGSLDQGDVRDSLRADVPADGMERLYKGCYFSYLIKISVPSPKWFA